MQLFKYMSTLALFDLILNRRLYFHPLHMFEDLWEGVPLPREEDTLREYGNKWLSNWPDSNIFCNMLQLGRVTSCVSCWHTAEDESIAMWKIYAGTGQGCCLVADRDKAIDCLVKEPGMIHFPVQYVNRESHVGLETELPPLYHSAQFKDLAYFYEQEYRFLLFSDPVLRRTEMTDGAIWTEPDLEKSKLTAGRYVNFDYSELSGHILISPFLKKHEKEIMVAMVSRVCDKAIPIGISRLAVK